MIKRSALFHVRRRGKKGMYYVYYYRNGKQVGEKISTDKGVVKLYLQKLLQRLDNERLGLPIKNYSFEQFCNDYIEKFAKANKEHCTVERDLRIIKSFRDKFPNIRYVDDFTADYVNQYKVLRKSDLCPCKKTVLKSTTIDRELNTLKSMLKYAYVKDYHLRNESERVKKINDGYKFEGRAIGDDEFERYLTYFKHPHKTALLIMAFAALRPIEAVRLRYSWIDFDNNMIYPNGTKTEKSDEVVPLHPQLKEYLLKLKETAKNDIICSDDNEKPLARTNLTATCYKVSKRYGLTRIRPYDLRHTAATKLFKAGANLLKVSKILRHSNVKTTSQVYIHALREDLKEDMNLLEYASSLTT